MRWADGRSSATKHRETRGSRVAARSVRPLVRRNESLSRDRKPVSGPIGGSGRCAWPLPFLSGCTRKVARPSSSARRKSRPRSACAQFSTTTYSSSSCRNSSAGFSNCGSTSTKSASTPCGCRSCALRVQVLRLALFQRGEEALHRFGSVAAVRQHLLERFLARLHLRAFRAQLVDAAAHLDGILPPHLDGILPPHAQ